MFLRVLLAFACVWGLAGAAWATGFQTVMVPDPGNPPISVGLWYPSFDPTRPVRISLDTLPLARNGAVAGTGLKLVMIAHGLGGGSADHVDTAYALAKAGFVAAAPSFTGDNAKDRSRSLSIWDRNRQLHVVTDWLLRSWSGHAHLDATHIGVFGFSAGGFTALVAAGGVPDFGLIAPHCAKYPAEFTCGYIANTKLPAPPPGAWVHDSRIKAAVIASPALGFTFGKAGLAGVRMPIQLWRGTQDQTLPQPFYAQAVANDLPSPPEYHVVPNARHLDFLSPCDAAKAKAAPGICSSLPGFDRAGFHAAFNAAVVGFFEKTLRARRE
jgi:predicted dienelactone hydrolase